MTVPHPSRPGVARLAGVSVLALTLSCGARSELPSTAPQDGVACTTGTVTLVKADPTLMFVLDRSGSMGGQLGHSSGQQSRWSVLTDALSATLPPVDATMAIGALLYPSGGGGGGHDFRCSVPGAPDLLPGVGNVGALLDLMQQTSPGGATPTADALDVAAGALAGVRAATSARALLLATDGGPNCNSDLDASTCRCATPGQICHGDGSMCLDDARTVERIGEYFAMGIPTYVIGIQDEGDNSFSDVLDAMADAGGRPQSGGAEHYYAARSPADLDAALATIRDQVGACTYLTTSVPDARGSITVTLNGTPIPYDPTGASGWMWGDRSNGEILLHGTACDTATMGASTLVAQVKCGG